MSEEEFFEAQWKMFCETYCAVPHPTKDSFYYKIAKIFFGVGRIFEKKENL